MKTRPEHNVLPSAEEIQQYQEGKLDSARMHEIEMLAQENPLLAEALEGFAAQPAFAALPLITASIATSAGITAATGASAAAGVAAAVKASTPWWHLNGWLIGVTAGTAAATGTYYYMEVAKDNAEDQKTEQVLNHDAQNRDGHDENTAMPFADSLNQPGQSIPENDAFTRTETQDLSSGREGSAENDESNRSGRSYPEIIASKPETAVETRSEGDDQLLKPSTVAIKIVHIQNYKTADYTAIRAKEWDSVNLEDLNVQARFQSNEEQARYRREHPEQVVPYMRYLELCLSAYDRKNYELAQRGFSDILAQYPDDVNALFYGAMSQYHQANYEKACALFEKVDRNMINTFDEEALFYRGKSLKALNRADEATSHFIRVVQMNGFYKEHALQEMQ